MPANILNGKHLAQQKLNKLQNIIDDCSSRFHRRPSLAVILIGNLRASRVYIKYKIAACHVLDIKSFKFIFEHTISESEIIAKIIELNNSSEIDGILVQLPLPAHIDSSKIMQVIDPKKDVDGFHPLNIGYLANNLPGLRPCTPKGIMSLLAHSGCEIAGKNAVVLGSSLIVGKPTALELIAQRATVTICNSKTQKIQEHVAQADILIVAIGKFEFVHGSWCKPGCIIIDVGINTDSHGKLAGDVHFASAVKVASWITPVPGGVGPMTVASLMENTVLAYKINNGL